MKNNEMRELNVNEIQEVNAGVYVVACYGGKLMLSQSGRIQSGFSALGKGLSTMYGNLGIKSTQIR